MSKIYLVKIRQLIIDMFMGVHEHEKHSRQRVAIDVELEMEYPADGFSKAIYKNVGCYETLVGEIKNLSKKGHIVLVETFADQIADIALADRRVITASVTVEKLDVFPDCDAVGTTIKKSRKKVT